ncbi:MAG TPA: acyl-CoA dehydrogenase family protein [Gammaproteobacteria bacterium]|nr:acyl-CoA dehydrogenase family protein [Gammaproteobacteria bacterium]
MNDSVSGQDTPSRDELLERAAGVREVLIAHAEETDRLRRLADANVAALKETGLCRLMVPKRFGGYQTDIHTYVAAMAEVGRGCGATAWVASLINVCAWLAGLFPERAQRDVWGTDPNAWVAGSLAPHGLATPTDGGWRVTGRWAWASGCLHADWAACGIRITDERGEVKNFGLSLMPMGELSIDDTWHMAGMKGTGSNTIVANEAFVPEHRFLPYPPAFEGRYRTEFEDEAVYRVALVPVTVLILVGAQLGVARAALDHTLAAARARGITHTNFAKQADSAGFQIQVAEAAMKIDTAYLHALRAADDLDAAAAAGRHPDLRERARVRLDTALAAKYCREAVDLLVEAHGTSSLTDANRMQRLWRDAHVASRHAITSWPVNLEIYGKALLDVEPNISALI